MSQTTQDVFQSIMTGLQEAIDYEKGILKKPVRTRVVTIAPLPHYQGKRIQSIRQKLQLTQVTFAEVFGVSKKTVEAWESGRNTPQGPAQRMLSILEAEQDFLEKYHILRIHEDVSA